MKRQFEETISVARKKIRHLDPELCTKNGISEVWSLFDISAMSVACHLPFEYVESSLINVPDLVQERIIYYSFPRDSADIKTYSSLMSYKGVSNEKSPFSIGEKMFRRNCIEDAIQIGFHLTGTVRPYCDVSGLLNLKTYKVSMKFDRCKIISVCCTCSSRGLSWCPHAVALALFRIKKPDSVNYRSPISDTLIKMDRNQLQKFAQYLIASHPTRVLASAQHLADRLLQEDSQLNKTCGAPDPTAGSGITDSSTWYFDESGVREQLRLDLASLATDGTSGCNAFETIASRTNNSSLSYTHDRPFTNFHHNRYFTDEGTAAKENGLQQRNFDYWSFAHTWLENYRHLRSKLPPFSYTTSAFVSASTTTTTISDNNNHNTVHSVPQHTMHGHGANSSQSSSPGFVPLSMTNTASHHLPGSQVATIFAKTYELLAARDTNGPHLLAIITEELLDSANLMILKSRRSNRSESLADRGIWDPYTGDLDEGTGDQQAARTSTNQPPPIWSVLLWEEVARLWTCLFLAPGFPPSARDSWRERLLAWSSSAHAPRDEIYHIPSCLSVCNPSSVEEAPTAHHIDREPTSVFQLALDVSQLPREVSEEFPVIPRNPLSNAVRIPSADSHQCTCPFCSASVVISRAWGGVEENFVTACLRASALQVMGFGDAATRLAVTLANTLIDCLEASAPAPLVSQTPSTGKASGINSSSSIITYSGGSGNQSRGGFKSPPPPLPHQHFSPFQQQRNHYQHNFPPISTGVGPVSIPSPYLHFSPPPPPPPASAWVFPYNHHNYCQHGRYRFCPCQRTPPRPDPSQYLFCSSEASLDCLYHKYGWLGLPGRPIISLVECLLEAASQKLQDPSTGGPSPSEYIYLALKVGILVLCQQRSLPSTSTALLASQAQEMLLIHLLDTIPRNTMTAQIIEPLVCQLMGPPTSSLHPSGAGTQEAWWWSALGPLVHSDTYPIHAVAELLFDHLLGGANTGELAYSAAARAMRLPMLEPLSDSPLVANAVNSALAAHRQRSDNAARPPNYNAPPSSTSSSSPNVLISPPLPSAFFNSPMTSLPRLPIAPPPPPNYRRQGQETPRRQHPAFVNQDSIAAAYRRDFGAMESRQARLAVSLILASRSAVFRVDQFMRVCDRHIHTSVGLLSVSHEVLAEAIGHRLHSSTSAFSLDEPSFPSNPSPATSALEGASTTGNLCFANLLPVNFMKTPLPASARQQRISLVYAAFHLALLVVMRTAWPRVHWRRREMLGWAVSTGLLAGPPALLYLAQAWSTYASPREAVTWLAPTLLHCVAHASPVGGTTDVNVSVSERVVVDVTTTPARSSAEGVLFLLPCIYSFLPFTPLAVEQIKITVRQMTIQAASQDPVNCALTALQLTELHRPSFEAIYHLVVEAAKSGSLGPTNLFAAARYLNSRGYPLWAFPLTVHAMRLFSLSSLQESHPVAHDVLWSCLLAHRISSTALQEILSHVVRNVHCPTLLADILHHCRVPPSMSLPPVPPSASQHHSTVCHPHHHHYHCMEGNHAAYTGYYPNWKQPPPSLLPVDTPLLKPLLDATISAFVAASHSRLASISPRQYTDFLDFLSGARGTFSLLKPDGLARFRQLVSCLCHSYRGKRKLVALLNERFHHT